MREGFFKDSELTVIVTTPTQPKCGACGLYKHCLSPKMPVSGEGRKRILIVGEAPGKSEDEKGIPFIGESGSKLKETLTKIGIDLRKDCWITNSIICHPKGNATPDKRKIEYCRPNLVKTVTDLQPDIIIPLGGIAAESVIGWLWKEDVGGISRWVGFQIPSQTPNAWICPTFHPDWLLRNDTQVANVVWESHLKAAAELVGKPWKKVPDYESRVRTIMNPEEAEEAILTMVDGAKTLTFDYETNCLKPDYDGAEIVTASFSNGKTAIAYPWHGAARSATAKVLRSGIGIIASNLKFEQRWTQKEFGKGVKNWAWDTMLAAHVLDNRAGVTGLKFQAFVRLGALAYDKAAKHYLQAKKGQKLNRIREMDLHTLLVYNGMDSLLEMLVAKRQMKELGL